MFDYDIINEGGMTNWQKYLIEIFTFIIRIFRSISKIFQRFQINLDKLYINAASIMPIMDIREFKKYNLYM